MYKNIENSIKQAISEGFTLTETGYGSYLENEKKYRERGLIVVSWYVPSDREGERKFELYTREKKVRRSKKIGGITLVKTPDYSAMTVKELRKICSEKKIAGYSKMNKHQILENLAS